MPRGTEKVFSTKCLQALTSCTNSLNRRLELATPEERYAIADEALALYRAALYTLLLANGAADPPPPPDEEIPFA